MIDVKYFFKKFNTNALQCSENIEGLELANLMEILINSGDGILSVSPHMVKNVWTWSENFPLDIYSRFVFNDKKEIETGNCIKNINLSLKNGATGVQIVLPFENLDDFIFVIEPIRLDVFFYKKLIIDIDILEIPNFGWTVLYDRLRRVSANALSLHLSHDSGNNSDFVGRIFAMFKYWDNQNDFDLFFVLNNSEQRIDQVYRIVEKKYPDLVKRLKFFISV